MIVETVTFHDQILRRCQRGNSAAEFGRSRIDLVLMVRAHWIAGNRLLVTAALLSLVRRPRELSRKDIFSARTRLRAVACSRLA